MEQDQQVAAARGTVTGSVLDGRGREAIRMWTLRRVEADLPDMGPWDGPLVALAIALMWDKGVEEEIQRFRQARSDVLDDFQIALDLRIGRDCIEEFTDRGASRRRSRADGPTPAAGAAGSRWDLFLSLVGHRDLTGIRSAVSFPAERQQRARLPLPRPVTA